MCITFLFTNPNNPLCPYKFILINNRDEFFARLTLEAELKNVGNLRTIHGTDIDAIEHGTWLGLSQRGDTIRIGNLLNVTGENVKKNARGRGTIVMEYIKTEQGIEDYNKKVFQRFDEFNGFNFLSVELKPGKAKVFNACNIDQSVHQVPMGYQGISNSPFCLPYMKVVNGQSQFKQLLDSKLFASKGFLIDSLLNFLKCESKHLPCQQLSQRRPEDAEVFSSIHVKHPRVGYGTRNRSVILIDHFHNIDYIEERMIIEDSINPVWERKNLKLEGNLRPKCTFSYLMGFSKMVGRIKAVL